MIRRTGYLFITAALLFAGSLPVSWAQATRLVQGRVRRIKACVAVIPSMGEPQPTGSTNPFVGANTPADPDAVNSVRSPGRYQYIFQVLNQRKDLKPDNWQFYNPAAPAYVTGPQATRWFPKLTIGTPLTANNAAYWEMLLNQANYDSLAQMDLIYLPICRRVSGMSSETGVPTFFTEEQRHVLSKLADSGVTIWVDWAVNGPTLDEALGGKDAANATPTQRTKDPFFTNLDFAAGNTVASDPVSAGKLIRHALLNDPFVFQSGEPSAIGSTYASNPASLQRALNLRVPSVEQTTNFEVVVPTSASSTSNPLAYIAAARYGAGRIVATAGNVGGAIAGMIADNTAAITISSVDFSLAKTESLKFAYNVAQWSSEVTAQQKNGRHTGQGNPQINGLFETSSYPYLAPPGGASLQSYPYVGVQPTYPRNTVSPLIVNNTIIAATNYLMPNGNSIFELNVFDQVPNNDFDQDGFTDDPINQSTPPTNALADISIGQPYDRIMTAPFQTPATGLTYGEVPDTTTGSNSRGYVFAASASGIFSLPAPRQGMLPAEFWSNATVATAPSVPQLGTVGFVGAPGFAVLPGPVGTGFTSRAQLYGGGKVTSSLFGTGAYGKIVAYDVSPNSGTPYKANMTPAWYYPSTQEASQMGVPSGPVVAAKVEDTGTHAIDTMVLTTTVSTGDASTGQTPAGAGDSTGKVVGIIVATEGDPLVFPKGNTAPNGNNPNSGSTFVCARWIDIPPGVGQVPQARDLMWDPTKQYEVRVMDLQQNYVLCRFVPGTAGFSILQNGTAGQIQLPAPTGQYSVFAKPNRPDTWDLDRYAILADYSPMPQPADQSGLTIRPRFTPATPYTRDAQQTSVPTGIAGGVSVGKDNLIYYGTGMGFMCAVENKRGRAQFRVKYRSLEAPPAGSTLKIGLSTNIDATDPAYLADYAFTAAPAAGDRVVFAAKSTGSQGTVYVFEPNPVIRFRLDLTNVNSSLLPLDAKRAQEVMIMADHGLGYNSAAPYLRATQQPWGRVPEQFTVDPDTATVTFQNMENFSLDLHSVKSPQELANPNFDTDGDGAIGPSVDTGGRLAVPIHWKFLSEPNNGKDHIAWAPLPLVALYQSPDQERWLSGPVISGDRIYLMGDSGTLHQLPLDPRTLDPSFPRRFDLAGNVVTGWNGFNMGNTTIYPGGLRKERNVAAGLLPTKAYHASPAVTDNMVAVSSTRGLTVFSSPSIIVADANRIVEASGDSTAIANTDVVTKYRTDNSDFAIPTDPSVTNTGNRPIFTERKLLSRPAVVRKLNRNSSLTSIFASSNVTLPPVDIPGAGITERSGLANESYLVADTGNNRIVEFNPAGQVIGEWADFYDPFGLLPSGEALKLSGPMDVQRWIEYENVQGLGTLTDIHTLIADTGNTRVIELVDKVLPQAGGSFNPGSYPVINSQTDASGQPIRWYHVLVWSSQTNAQGLKLRYRTAQRVFWTDSTGTPIPAGKDSQSLTHFPYLPDEQYVSYTMATVSGAAISYPGTPTPADYLQMYGGNIPQSVLDRVPDVRAGSDSVVYLRGRYKLDEGTGPTSPVLVPFVREARQNLATADNYRFAQGVIDPNVPIFTTIYDEVIGGSGGSITPASDNPVHRLNGVASVQRTIRSDVKFQPEGYQSSSPMPRAPYLLIADTDGVWEARMVSSPGNHPQYRLSMAFTVEDYAYCTGTGNGDPTKLYTGLAADNSPGGRRLSAVSARRLPTGLILVTSRTAGNDVPNTVAAGFQNLNSGPDIFLLRPIDYRTATERSNLGLKTQYDRYNLVDGSGNPLHGWQPDLWVQQFGGCPPALKGASSIRWHAADQLNSTTPPSLRTQLQFGPNPNELTGTYNPVQPSYADVVF